MSSPPSHELMLCQSCPCAWWQTTATSEHLSQGLCNPSITGKHNLESPLCMAVKCILCLDDKPWVAQIWNLKLNFFMWCFQIISVHVKSEKYYRLAWINIVLGSLGFFFLISYFQCTPTAIGFLRIQKKSVDNLVIAQKLIWFCTFLKAWESLELIYPFSQE